jgi:hypothetical protein
VIEKWDPKIKMSQIKTVKISPMFGADAVRLYKDANEAHPATAAVKSLEAAEKLRAVVGMKFMVGCDKVWTFPDDDQPNAAGPAAGPAGQAMAALSPTAAADDAPPPPAPPVDPSDLTKWNVFRQLALLKSQ